jgi:error-prone DNA polymerase
VILSATMLAARGVVQREGEVVHLIVHKIADLSNALATIDAGDFAMGCEPPGELRIKSRNFH